MERFDNEGVIEHIATPRPTYLDKEAWAAELPVFAAFWRLATLPQLPDLIHVYFADAAFVALQARRRFGIWLDDPGRPIVLAIAGAVWKKNLASLLRALAVTPDLAARANLVILAGQQDAHAAAEERAVVEELHRLGVERTQRQRLIW
ncbi:hypothetical protein [Roseicella sp. DB1501]|uniref:hypothetical protein n=1 Tax=Roseicella sp. DB1501 TaxID=2730925 RepID=UPI001491AA60|nr:hypothetical protein [Roseicella sp. DB1501]NOG72249.1 hypothetical protein [Roseicella sp. DB1501]